MFDPLDFLSTTESVESNVYNAQSKHCKPVLSKPLDTCLQNELDSLSKDELDSCNLVHIMDLPPISLMPPFRVLNTILKLLGTTQVTNFNMDYTTQTELDMTLLTPCIMEWLKIHWPPLSTETHLSTLAANSNTLRYIYMSEYNAYMTCIVASPLSWLLGIHAHKIHTMASARLAENCGRTAQPGMNRKIMVNGLDSPIHLYEPSLTSDNLGLKTWGSALVLSQRIVQSYESLVYGSVLELGAGTGLVGLICDKLGFQTTLTDLAEIVANLAHNVALNGALSTVSQLDWRRPHDFAVQFGPDIKYDTIIASDPIYSIEHPHWLVKTVKMFLRQNESARVLLQLPLRRLYEMERNLLWTCMAESGFEVISEAIESGSDEFGDLQFVFKMLKWKRHVLNERA